MNWWHCWRGMALERQDRRGKPPLPRSRSLVTKRGGWWPGRSMPDWPSSMRRTLRARNMLHVIAAPGEHQRPVGLPPKDSCTHRGRMPPSAHGSRRWGVATGTREDEKRALWSAPRAARTQSTSEEPRPHSRTEKTLRRVVTNARSRSRSASRRNALSSSIGDHRRRAAGHQPSHQQQRRRLGNFFATKSNRAVGDVRVDAAEIGVARICILHQ